MINQEDLTKNIDRSRLLSQAKTMLDQNIPMETISQQLGLDRNTLNDLLLQNQLMHLLLEILEVIQHNIGMLEMDK